MLNSKQSILKSFKYGCAIIIKIIFKNLGVEFITKISLIKNVLL